MKIGVSSYSFYNLVKNGAMTQLDTIRKAKDMGFDFIEFASIDVPQGGTAKEQALKLRNECERVGLPVECYLTGADFLKPEGPEAEAERLRGELELAKILGVPMMRHDATYGIPKGYVGKRGFYDVLPTLVKGCLAVTEYAAELGIKTMVENHGFFCQDSSRVEALVNGVNHKNFGTLVDIGNFLCADEDPAQAVARMAPYMFHMHAKDFHIKPGTAPDPGTGWFRSRSCNYLRGAIIGHGEVPVTQCIRLVREAGYDGTVSLEFEGMEDPVTGISVGLANLKKYLG